MTAPATSNVCAPDSCAPPLTGKLAPWMKELLAAPDEMRKLSGTYGSPLHVVVGSEFARNTRDLISPLKDREIEGNLFFARKANKLPWFVSLAGEQGLGVDTASLTELKETLDLGIPGPRIIVTAIGKDRPIIEAAVEAGALLVIDNFDELSLIDSVAASLGKTARTGLRLSGFRVNGNPVFSRFGITLADADAAFEQILSSKSLRLELLHAHLDRYDTTERATAGFTLIELADTLKAKGVEIRGIDLGGGIVMRYLDSSTQWQGFQDELLAAVQNKRPGFTYRDDGLGYVRAGDQVLGTPDLYPAWNDYSKERFISRVLDTERNGVSLAKALRQRNLHLFFEPGRALLDNAGMTILAVTFRKRDTLGNLLVGLKCNRMNLRPFRAEFCVDPLLLVNGQRESLKEGVFLVGNLCSESDLITRRKLTFEVLPQPEDLLCFPNTAGYLMHHMEIGTHGDPLPTNVLLDEAGKTVKAVI